MLEGGTQSQFWDSKITLRNPQDLIAAEYNPRTLSDDQFKSISDSLKRFGFVDPVIINKNKDRKDIIIGGHQRTKVATALGFTEVPTIELNLTYAQEKELNIRLNKNTGAFDFDMLANHFETSDLIDWGFQEWELDIAGDIDLEDFFEDIEEDQKEEETENIITLNLSQADYDKAMKYISKVGKSAEEIFMTLIEE